MMTGIKTTFAYAIGIATAFTHAIGSTDAEDAMFWGGFGCLWWGCHQIYPPAGPIACGALLIAVSLYTGTLSIIVAVHSSRKAD